MTILHVFPTHGIFQSEHTTISTLSHNAFIFASSFAFVTHLHFCFCEMSFYLTKHSKLNTESCVDLLITTYFSQRKDKFSKAFMSQEHLLRRKNKLNLHYALHQLPSNDYAEQSQI